MFGLIPYTAKLANREMNREMFNPFSDDFFRAFFSEDRPIGPLKVDVLDKGDHYILEADLPGVNKENVRVAIHDGVLTISADLKDEKEEKEKTYVYRERRYGRMCRSFNLDGIKESDIAAEYRDGMLKLTHPKETEVATGTREITIN